MKPKLKPSIFNHVCGAIVLWLLALYVLLTGDPTRILLLSSREGAQRQPEEAVGLLFLGGVVVIGFGLWHRYNAR